MDALKEILDDIQTGEPNAIRTVNKTKEEFAEELMANFSGLDINDLKSSNIRKMIGLK